MNKLNIFKRKFDWRNFARLRGLALLLLTAVMLGLNYLPTSSIDPFSRKSDKKLNTKIKVATVETFELGIAKKFNSVDDLYCYLCRNSDTSNKFALVLHASRILRKRFHHAYSIYSMQENWMAVLAGKLIWRNLCAKVIPDDILKGDVAACSQVSIVFMNLCNKFGIPSRKIGLKGHYTVEAYIDNGWHFFDMDLKPNFKVINGHKSINDILNKREQYALYANTILDTPDINRVFSKIEYGVPNMPPAPRAYVFHYVTKILSHWGWLIPLAALIYSLKLNPGFHYFFRHSLLSIFSLLKHPMHTHSLSFQQKEYNEKDNTDFSKHQFNYQLNTKDN